MEEETPEALSDPPMQQHFDKVYRRLAFEGAYLLRRIGGVKKLMLTYPELPYPGTALWRISRMLGWRLTKDLGSLEDADAVFRWQDATFAKPWPTGGIARRIYNRDIVDISKNRVDAVHQEAFGYSLGLDGSTWRGKMLLKPIENARHSGEVITGPLKEIPKGFMCQRVVDNTEGADRVMDLRVVFFDGDIPFGYRKYRPLSTRFSNTNQAASLFKPSHEFSQHELERITGLARAMKLDYGEMDVLRDKSDGRIFVCDVNTTPFGPPNNILKADYFRALDLYLSSFVGMMERGS